MSDEHTLGDPSRTRIHRIGELAIAQLAADRAMVEASRNMSDGRVGPGALDEAALAAHRATRQLHQAIDAHHAALKTEADLANQPTPAKEAVHTDAPDASFAAAPVGTWEPIDADVDEDEARVLHPSAVNDHNEVQPAAPQRLTTETNDAQLVGAQATPAPVSDGKDKDEF